MKFKVFFLTLLAALFLAVIALPAQTNTLSYTDTTTYTTKHTSIVPGSGQFEITTPKAQVFGYCNYNFAARNKYRGISRYVLTSNENLLTIVMYCNTYGGCYIEVEDLVNNIYIIEGDPSIAKEYYMGPRAKKSQRPTSVKEVK